MSTFRTIRSERRYAGFSTVRVDTVAADDAGGVFEREVVEHAAAVAIVAVDAAGRVALVEQYRQPLGTTLLEIPAGTLDVPGEAVRAAALRELAEEIGHTAGHLEELGVIWNSAGWSDERTTILLARDVRPAPRPAGFVLADEEAVMTLTWVPLADLVARALDGTITDAKTVIGVLRAAAHMGVMPTSASPPNAPGDD